MRDLKDDKLLEKEQQDKDIDDELRDKIFTYICSYARGVLDLTNFLKREEHVKDKKDFPASWKKSSIVMYELTASYGLEEFEFPLTIPEQFELWQTPLSQWKIKHFEQVFYIPFDEPVLYDGDVSDFCKELANLCQIPEDREIAPFLDILLETRKYCEEEEYWQIRKFIVENPIIHKDELESALFVIFRGSLKKYRERIEALYEDIPLEYWDGEHVIKCPYCGWTLKKTTKAFGNFKGDDAFAYRCNSEKCMTHANQWQLKDYLVAADYRRVKRGVQEYIVEPGIIELSLYKQLEALFGNYRSFSCSGEAVLYPECDFADILLKLPHNEVWVIDAKDWRSPQSLALELNQKKLFTSYKGTEYDKGIVVVPKSFGKDYIKILKAYWKQSNNYEIWNQDDLIEKVTEYLRVKS